MFIKRYWKSILVYLFLVVMSLLPAGDPEEPTKQLFDIGLDKYKHVLAFGFLSLVLVYEFAASSRKMKLPSSKIILAFLIASIGGVLVEVLQVSFPELGRVFNPVDIFANTIGCVIVMVFLFVLRWGKRENRS